MKCKACWVCSLEEDQSCSICRRVRLKRGAGVGHAKADRVPPGQLKVTFHKGNGHTAQLSGLRVPGCSSCLLSHLLPLFLGHQVRGPCSLSKNRLESGVILTQEVFLVLERNAGNLRWQLHRWLPFPDSPHPPAPSRNSLAVVQVERQALGLKSGPRPPGA